MYWQLRYTYPRDENDYTYDLDDGVDFDGVKSWALGEPFEKSPPDPIRLTLHAGGGHDEDEPPFSGAPPDMFDGYLCLMSKPMVEALLGVGVGNLATYRALLVDDTNAREFEYFAVNILGLVAAADLKKSAWENLDGDANLDTHFDELVVDPKKIGGRLIFRLAEDTARILVQERVKEALEAANLKTLTFDKVQ